MLTSDKKSYSKTVLKLTFHINICAFSIKSTEVACFTNVTSMFLYGDIRDIPSFPFLYFTAVYVCPSDIWRGPSHNTFKSQISALYNRMMLIHVCYCHWSCQMRTVTDVCKLLDNSISCCWKQLKVRNRWKKEHIALDKVNMDTLSNSNSFSYQ